jgi:2-aminobenzoate-CoA ligase
LPRRKRAQSRQHDANARRQLAKIVDKAEIALALCDTRLMDELVAVQRSRFLQKVIGPTVQLTMMLSSIASHSKPVRFDAEDRRTTSTPRLTSGTTGEPKATMHSP